MTNKRAHVYYEGSVQGIGFRFAARSCAAGLKLGGWVKNLDDGRVEVVCQGDERKIKVFLDKMASDFGGYIRNTNIEWSAAADEYDGFGVRFDS